MSGPRRQGNRRATIKDVAQRAEVAISTVSHVINNTASITPETRQRILIAIDELNYTPNVMARELRQKHTSLIGIVIPDISNEFYAECASGLLSATDGAGHTVLVCDTGYNAERERNHVEALIERRIEGLVFFGGSNDELLHLARRANIHVVLGDRISHEFCSVEFDNTTPMHLLMEGLSVQGVRKIGYISESLEFTNVRKRYEAFINGVERLGMEYNSDWILIDRRLQLNKMQSAGVLMKELLERTSRERLPEVFMTSNDMVAIGVMECLREHGLRVPEDIGVTGIDDIRFARYYRPALTTIRQNTYQMGCACFDLLKKKMEGDTGTHHLMLDCEPVIRNSILLCNGKGEG